MKKTVTIIIEQTEQGEWVATCKDVLQNGYLIVMSEDTASWALSHVCEDIVEQLTALRDSGNDWPG